MDSKRRNRCGSKGLIYLRSGNADYLNGKRLFDFRFVLFKRCRQRNFCIQIGAGNLTVILYDIRVIRLPCYRNAGKPINIVRQHKVARYPMFAIPLVLIADFQFF